LAQPLAQESQKQPLDPALAKIISAWANLPEPIRRAMLALAQSAE
jgi:hypothetical protein